MDMKKFRTKFSLSQTALAKKLGVAQQWVSDMERGVLHMSKRDKLALARLADILKKDGKHGR